MAGTRACTRSLPDTRSRNQVMLYNSARSHHPGRFLGGGTGFFPEAIRLPAKDGRHEHPVAIVALSAYIYSPWRRFSRAFFPKAGIEALRLF